MVKRTLASTGELVDIDRSNQTDEERLQEEKANSIPMMAVKVYAPFKVYYEGKAVSLTAENETGPFDILPKHHNFLCMLIPCELIITTPFDVQKVKISRALMHVKSEKVTVFVDV
jgi:F0F1-type ATP synthase epsilon subunit